MQPFLLEITKACKDIAFTNFGQVGDCLVDATMFGSTEITGVLILIMFGVMTVRYGLPITMILPLSSGLVFTMWLLTGSTMFMAIFILTLVVMGMAMIIAFLNYLNR